MNTYTFTFGKGKGKLNLEIKIIKGLNGIEKRYKGGCLSRVHKYSKLVVYCMTEIVVR